MSAFIPTKHGRARMSQRAIRHADLELAVLIGTEVEGGYFVCERAVQEFVRERKKEIDRAVRLAGVRVVHVGDTIVTAYHAGRGKQRRLLRRA